MRPGSESQAQQAPLLTISSATGLTLATLEIWLSSTLV